MLRPNPFNPQQPARPDFFIGREPEVVQFEKFLSQTITDSPMNMSITGNRGMGKTSLLVKYEQIAKENRCLVIRLSNYEGNIKSILELCDFISSNLKSEILSKKPLSKLTEWIKTIKPTIEWNDMTFTIDKVSIAQELFRTRLIKLWDETKGDFKAIVILIDEAEAMEKVPGALPFLRETFQRVSTDANYMVVLAGKLNFPERTSESFSPLNRFFPVQKLKPFSEWEIRSYLVRKLSQTEMRIDEYATNYLIRESEGHPYVLVAMCYLLFDSLREEEGIINEELITKADQKVKQQLSQDFFSPMFHPLSKKAKEVLLKIARNTKSLEFTFKEAINWTNIGSEYLSPYILELFRKGILNKPERAKYKIFHTLFLKYLKESDEQKLGELEDN